MKPGVQYRIPATYMRGGTSKGVFFHQQDLPEFAQVPGSARDALLLRVIGSPDPYGKHIDGMGGATSSTSKAVILSKSTQPGHDVDYWFAQIAIEQALVDWRGNCGNLSAAVGPFAISHGLIASQRIPENGVINIRIWQANTKKSIIAQVPIINGEVQAMGDFELDGVTFPAAEIPLTFIDPVDAGVPLFPTGNPQDTLIVPNLGTFSATMINAGIPTIFLNAEDIGYTGTEQQAMINNDAKALNMFETIRAYGALRMGLIETIEAAANQQHIPKIAFVAPSTDYTSSSGKRIKAADIDLNVRALSMGKLHHAMMGTAAVAIGTAAAIPATLVNQVARKTDKTIKFGHPSGVLEVGVEVNLKAGAWSIHKVTMSRSARVLMEGWVHVPYDTEF